MVKKRDPLSKPVGDAQRILLEKLDEMGVDMKTASTDWLHKNPAYIQQYIFRGTPQFLSEADRFTLSTMTGITEDRLGRPPNVVRPDTQTFERPSIVPYEGPSMIKGGATVPIYAAAMGGKGHLIITSDPVDHLPPPLDLLRVRDAYGIIIVGESMVPAFRPGDIAWVHPHKHEERDADVVLYHVNRTAEAEAMVKTLVSWTPDDWKLRQYNPSKSWTESRHDWPICHRIVGKRSVR